MSDKVPHHHEEPESHENKNSHEPHEHTNKNHKKGFMDKCVTNPGFPWMVIAILFTLLVIMFFREHSLYPNQRNMFYMRDSMIDRNMPEMRNDFSRFHMRSLGDEFENFRAEQQEFYERMNRIHESMMNTPASVGKYNGTRIINDKTISYVLDIGEKTISGTLSGTDSDMIGKLTDSLKKLGYTVENSSTGYIFTGDASKSPMVIQLFQ